MPKTMDPKPPDSSHDDLSNAGPRGPAAPVVDNEAHDQTDDGAGAPYPDSDSTASGSEATKPVTKKPLSDMAPPGQDQTSE